jgi:CHAT domain-containing protein
MRYVLGWDAGATAEIELHMPQEEGTFGLRYNSPYRSTFRSPTGALRVGPGALEQSRLRLQQLASSLQLIPGRGPGTGGAAPVQATRTLEAIGRELYELILPNYIQSDLKKDPLFIELAIDEEMLFFPWELMYDDEQFLGHKHALGRYVNLKQPLMAQTSRPYGFGDVLEDLKVLVIGVPRPQTEESIEELTAVEPEVTAITDILTDIGIEPTLLLGREADYDSVRAELRKEYHIIHFSGHATFDETTPSRSALLLFDAKIETGVIMSSFTRHPAILCFVNACEAARTTSEDGQAGDAASEDEAALRWESRYNNYGLARAFLETGSYLLGSRWRLEDEPARIFARTFYEAALRSGEPLGRAIANARAETARQSPADSCAWASYVYYGDPRVSFRPAEAPTATEEIRRGPRIRRRRAPRAEPREVDSELRENLEALARTYDEIRATQPSGWQRTAEMTRVSQEAARMASSAADATAPVPHLFEYSDGGRVLALAILRESPDPTHFELALTAITGSHSAFEQYVGLEAMRALAPLLDSEQATRLREAIEGLGEHPDFFGTDRYVLANQIATQLSDTEPPVLA